MTIPEYVLIVTICALLLIFTVTNEIQPRPDYKPLTSPKKRRRRPIAWFDI